MHVLSYIIVGDLGEVVNLVIDEFGKDCQFNSIYAYLSLLAGDGENPAISEQSADGGDYLSAQETAAKVDIYSQAVDLEVVPGEPTLTSESAELGGAGGGVWEQYNGEGREG